MSVERDRFLKGCERMMRRNESRLFRPALIHGRRAESTVDTVLLPVRSVVRLRDEAGNRIAVSDYSNDGGPDVMA